MREPLVARVSSARVGGTTLLSAAGLIVVAAVDLASGTELSLSLFYLGPIALLAWRTGVLGGAVAAVAGAAIWYGVDTAGGAIYAHPLIPLWNAFVRLGFFIIVSLLLVRQRRGMEREVSLARTDPLTGLLNRRAFGELATREVERSRRTGLPLTFAYVDLDDFKGVNDRLGHSAGDEVLCTVSRVMELVMRNVDIKARLGGDEFALVMPDTDATAATAAIDRLLTGLAAAAVQCSVGTVVFVSSPPDVAGAIAAVDAVMYEVKSDPTRRTALRVVTSDDSRPDNEDSRPVSIPSA
jgi:diguanylate cyclase (GGDEF)-like protein